MKQKNTCHRRDSLCDRFVLQLLEQGNLNIDCLWITACICFKWIKIVSEKGLHIENRCFMQIINLKLYCTERRQPNRSSRYNLFIVKSRENSIHPSQKKRTYLDNTKVVLNAKYWKHFVIEKIKRDWLTSNKNQ